MNTRSAQTSVPVPLDIVGSSSFGRYPKISVEQTFNQFIADGFSVNFSGYQFVAPLLEKGRGLYPSNKGMLMFAASDDKIFKITEELVAASIGSLTTSSGDVYVDEDLLGNIAFCDGDNIYIYNYISGLSYIAGTAVNASTKVITPLDFDPNYIQFHDGRFIATSALSNGVAIGQWRLSTTTVTNDGTVYVIFPDGAQFQGSFQTKPDLPQAVVRFPGRESYILIFGSIVTELWSDQGLALFPYVRNSTFDLDFGCVNAATIAKTTNMVVWLGRNERAGPVIMYTVGQDIVPISTDGINERLEQLKAPESSSAFIYVQSGHTFYVITFYSPLDNITFMYDFSTQKFFTLCDENLNYFIAKNAVFFNNNYYILSINDGNLYQIDSAFTTYEYENNKIQQIPRMRVCKTIRSPNNTPLVFNDLSFVIETGIDTEYTGQGNNIAAITVTAPGSGYTTCDVLIEGDGEGAYATATIVDGAVTGIAVVYPGSGYTWAVTTLIGDGKNALAQPSLNVASYMPRADLSISYDGGYTWSSFDQMQFNILGKYKIRFYYNNLGYGNEFTLQFRFWCNSRFVCSDGLMNFYQ